MPHTRPAADVCAQNAAYNDYDIVSLTRARSHGEACKQRAEDARARAFSVQRCNFEGHERGDRGLPRLVRQAQGAERLIAGFCLRGVCKRCL